MIDRRRHVAILGIPVDNVTMDEAVATIDRYIQERCFHQVATANVNFLMNAVRNAHLMNILQNCSLVVPDGMPLVWAARLMEVPLRERVTGYNLVPRLAQLAAEKNYGIFLLGTSEECSAGAAAWIEQNHPGARIAGRYAPPFGPLETMDHAEILERIEKAQPDILLVAFGNPKQEQWLAMHGDRLRVPVAIGVGGSLNFLAGQVKYTPRWMQDCGLEAIYRVWQEPRRLGGRYLRDLWGVCRYLLWQVLAARVQSRKGGAQRISHFWLKDSLVIRPEGRFTTDLVAELDELLSATAKRQGVIIDLSRTKSIGADALATLIRLNCSQRIAGQELALAGLSRQLSWLFASSRVQGHFRIVPTAEYSAFGKAELAHQRS